jgi:putative two-component system response regulator
METLKKSNILFVDDEYHVLDGLRRMLSKHRNDFNMVFAASVNEALKVIDEGDFDTVVSDITMPERDGFDLLKTLRESANTRDLPVVILTGLYDKEVKKQALEWGATDILNKPVDQEELLARLQSCIRQKSYLDEIKELNNNLQLKVKERTLDLAQSRLDMILRLGYLAEFREQVSGTHGIKVGCYSRAIGETLGLDAKFLERMFVASTLHDVGKIGIPDRVLNKQGPLNFDEWALVK